jgi:long-chain acyl-CoA synthetase
MAIDRHAVGSPEKAASILIPTALSMSYSRLNDDSARLARVLRTSLNFGDRVAILMENRSDYLLAAWAGRRGGLRTVPVNVHLTPGEVSYIIRNSNAKALITSAALSELATASIVDSELELFFSVDDTFGQFQALEGVLQGQSPLAPSESAQGTYMFYSSGTTGRPKGILRPMPVAAFGSPTPQEELRRIQFGIDSATVYLCPSPLYHAAPLAWTVGVQAAGGTVIIMPKFDAETFLDSIERYRVTHAQVVPTHFVRLLRLPVEIRSRFDLSSLQSVVHTGAPCAPEVKREMIAWFGPIIHDYYGSSEGAGVTTVDSTTWLKKPGTVGKPISGQPHVLDDDGRELSYGEIGTIWFEGIERVQYHNDDKATTDFANEKGWGSVGDVGWLDEDGYLFLADRKHHMIISGGVNIYPQEIENELVLYPEIVDAAVIGVPNAEYGEEVKAVIQLAAGITGSDALKDQILAFCRTRLAGYKCPRSIDFVAELPRLPNGKLLKRRLRETYAEAIRQP